MSDDAVRIVFDYLLRLPAHPVKKLDIFLVSNGGNGTVPWRLVSLFREFSQSFNVLVPYRAYSAATLLALGADEIVMHPFGELGPIDPTVGNEFNPVDKLTGRRAGISVEDVKAYVSFIKQGVGINHEDELIKAIEILAKEVHPLALGNVERFLSQSRMMATKIMRTHMKDESEHAIKEIVENLASKLYFHGHPINRKEARDDLDLKILANPTPALEAAMWNLYLDFEKDFLNQDIFSPQGDIAALPDPAPPGSPGGPPPPKEVRYDFLHATVESADWSSVFRSERRYREVRGLPPGQMALQEDILKQGWRHSSLAQMPVQPQSLSSSPADTQSGAKTPANPLARKPRRR
jgi:hypothetical protein